MSLYTPLKIAVVEKLNVEPVALKKHLFLSRSFGHELFGLGAWIIGDGESLPFRKFSATCSWPEAQT